MGCYVLGFQEIDQAQVAVVGGKGAHLGELSRIEDLRVPAVTGVEHATWLIRDGQRIRVHGTNGYVEILS